MSINTFQNNSCKATNNKQSIDFVYLSLFIARLRSGIWMFGIPSWLFGITDRGVASFVDGYVSPIEFFHVMAASLFFISWLYLKPEISLNSAGVDLARSDQSDLEPNLPQVYLHAAQARMLELQEQHMIRQEYILPFPYLCQIYHLLNLKHLETIHSFSLNNLKVTKVSDFQPTAIGGILKFQTHLDSPMNALRIWRQPIVEVGLTLHTPYTVELSIPVYNDKKIIVIFNAVPLSQTEHRLFIDIYSNLEWPKSLLQVILHFASCLTLYEDLPYLRKLAEGNIQRLFNLNRVSNHETMWLFNRFVELYGSSLQPSQPIKTIEAVEEPDESAIAVAKA